MHKAVLQLEPQDSPIVLLNALNFVDLTFFPLQQSLARVISAAKLSGRATTSGTPNFLISTLSTLFLSPNSSILDQTLICSSPLCATSYAGSKYASISASKTTKARSLVRPTSLPILRLDALCFTLSMFD